MAISVSELDALERSAGISGEDIAAAEAAAGIGGSGSYSGGLLGPEGSPLGGLNTPRGSTFAEGTDEVPFVRSRRNLTPAQILEQARAQQAQLDAVSTATYQPRQRVVIRPEGLTDTEIRANGPNAPTKFAMGTVGGLARTGTSVVGAVPQAYGYLADNPAAVEAGRNITSLGGALKPAPGTEGDFSNIAGEFVGSTAGLIGSMALGGPVAGAVIGGAQGFTNTMDAAKDIQVAKRREDLAAAGLDPDTPLTPQEEQDINNRAGRAGLLAGGLGAATGGVGSLGTATALAKGLVSKEGMLAMVKKFGEKELAAAPTKLATREGLKYVARKGGLSALEGGGISGAQRVAENVGISSFTGIPVNPLEGVPAAVVGGTVGGGVLGGYGAADLVSGKGRAVIEAEKLRRAPGETNSPQYQAARSALEQHYTNRPEDLASTDDAATLARVRAVAKAAGIPEDLLNDPTRSDPFLSSIDVGARNDVKYRKGEEQLASYGVDSKNLPDNFVDVVTDPNRPITSPAELRARFPEAKNPGMYSIAEPTLRSMIRQAHRDAPPDSLSEKLTGEVDKVTQPYLAANPELADSPFLDDVYRGFATLKGRGYEYDVREVSTPTGKKSEVTLGAKSHGDDAAKKAVEAINRGLNGLHSERAKASGPTTGSVALNAAQRAALPTHAANARDIFDHFTGAGFTGLNTPEGNTPAGQRVLAGLEKAFGMGGQDTSARVEVTKDADGKPIYTVTANTKAQRDALASQVRSIQENYGPSVEPAVIRTNAWVDAVTDPKNPAVTPKELKARFPAKDNPSLHEQTDVEIRQIVRDRLEKARPDVADDVKKLLSPYSPEAATHPAVDSIYRGLLELKKAVGNKYSIYEKKTKSGTVPVVELTTEGQSNEAKAALAKINGGLAALDKEPSVAIGPSPARVAQVGDRSIQQIDDAVRSGELSAVSYARGRVAEGIADDIARAFNGSLSDANKASLVSMFKEFPELRAMTVDVMPGADGGTRIVVRAPRVDQMQGLLAKLRAFAKNTPEIGEALDIQVKQSGTSKGPTEVVIAPRDPKKLAEKAAKKAAAQAKPPGPKASGGGETTTPPSPASLGATLRRRVTPQEVEADTKAVRNTVQKILGDNYAVEGAPVTKMDVASLGKARADGKKSARVYIENPPDDGSGIQRTASAHRYGNGDVVIFVRPDAARRVAESREEAGHIVLELLRVSNEGQYKVLENAMRGKLEIGNDGAPVVTDAAPEFQRLVDSVWGLREASALSNTAGEVSPSGTIPAVSEMPNLREGATRELKQMMGDGPEAMRERMAKAVKMWSEGAFIPGSKSEAFGLVLKQTQNRVRNMLRGMGYIDAPDILSGIGTGDVGTSGKAEPRTMMPLRDYLAKQQQDVGKAMRSKGTVIEKADRAATAITSKIINQLFTPQIEGQPLRTEKQITSELVTERLERDSRPYIKNMIDTQEARLKQLPDPEGQRELAYRWFTNDFVNALERHEVEGRLDPQLRAAVDGVRHFMDSLSQRTRDSGILREKADETFKAMKGSYVARLYAIDLDQGNGFRRGFGQKNIDSYFDAKTTSDPNRTLTKIIDKVNNGSPVGKEERMAYNVWRATDEYSDPERNGWRLFGALGPDGSVMRDPDGKVQLITDIDADTRHRIAEGHVLQMLRARDESAQIGSPAVLDSQITARSATERDRLRKRDTELPQFIRDLYGEIRDPAIAAYHSIADQNALLANARLLVMMRDAIREDGTPYFFKDPTEAMRVTKQPESSFVQMTGDPTSLIPSVNGAVEGMWTTRDVAESLNDMATRVPGKLSQLARTLNRTAQRSMTLFNPGTYMRNAWSDFGEFAFGAGVSPVNPANWGLWRDGFFAAVDPTGRGKKVYDTATQFMEPGKTDLVVDFKINSDVERMVNRLTDGHLKDGEFDSTFQKIQNDIIGSKVDVIDKLQNLYSLSSRMLRYATFMKQYNMNGGDGRAAAQYTNDFTPTYSVTPRVVNNFERMMPFFASMFLKFQAQQYRIAGNLATKAPLRLLGLVALRQAVKAGLIGVGAGSLEAAKNYFFPTPLQDEKDRSDWAKAQKLLPNPEGANMPVGRVENGKKVLDFLPLDSVFSLSEVMSTAERGQDPLKWKETMRKIVGANPALDAGAMLLTGQDVSGRNPAIPAYKQFDTGERIAGAAKIVGKSLLPPILGGSEYGRLAGAGIVPNVSPLDPNFGLPQGAIPNRYGVAQSPEYAIIGLATGIRPVRGYADIMTRSKAFDIRQRAESLNQDVGKSYMQFLNYVSQATDPSAKAQIEARFASDGTDYLRVAQTELDRYDDLLESFQSAVRLGMPLSPAANENMKQIEMTRSQIMGAMKKALGMGGKLPEKAKPLDLEEPQTAE